MLLGKGRHNNNSNNKRSHIGKDGEDEGESDGGWVQWIDAAVWEHCSSDARYRHVYDAGKIAHLHLLHFIRNSPQHPPLALAWSAAKAAFAAE